MKKLIAGNWKMNLGPKEAQKLCEALSRAEGSHADILICPPFLYLQDCARILQKSSVKIGAQDCSYNENGAHTGDISAEMLKSLGCEYVILGHSERRQGHGESSDTVRRKAAMAQKHGLIPIICIGETEAEREAGQAQDVAARQIEESLPQSATADNTVIAYEPVWAIGTGNTASPQDVKDMHGFIRSRLKEKLADSENLRILYGGSMKPENAGELLATENVDGGLIGGASLESDPFLEIVGAVK